MKHAYIEKKFKPSSLIIIDQANEIIDEYLADGLRLTLRQLYYQFVSRALIANKQKEYKRLGAIISDARLAGMIDWYAIEDRTRALRGNTHWQDPGQIIRAAVSSFRLDRWEGQRYRPEVWIEKEALVGVIAGICQELDVDYFACKGYVSQSEMWSASQRLQNYMDIGQEPVIIHLGDHDPSGIDMTRDIEERMSLLMDFGCSVQRIALNMNQIEDYSPPPNPAKLTDSRYSGYIKKHGSSSWELDALEPRVLRDLIRHQVLIHRDENTLNDIMQAETQYKKTLTEFANNWR
jgi:hypothetical protein